jgi:head-tail adaptor
MAKRASPGEMRTSVFIEAYTETQDADGYPVKAWANVFGGGKRRHTKWVNAHGTEAYEAMRMELKEPATLTMRYSPLITPQCRIKKVGDTEPFEIISMNDVENRHEWLEIKVQRTVSAK